MWSENNTSLNQSFAITTGADQALLGPNPKRKGMVFSAPQTGRVSIAFQGAAVLDQGITLYAGGNSLVLMPELVGNAIMGEIRIIGSAGAITFAFVEFIAG